MLDAAAGTLRWAVDQRPIGIYTYTPALLGGDAVAMRNCLNTLGANSLCVYTRRQPQPQPTAAQPQPQPAAREQAPAASVAAGGVTPFNGPVATSGGAAAQAALPVVVTLLCALAPFLF